ncbi:hypothetical protein UFOVP585_22 [uncultured Caudovirales phage]|uniref:Uncharacterized protein n=1 Tax=uncultured Caudovirales phage TaxID=2100421 RepID=A0A6J5N727_9CAUD|nr:hypothetical protein UFOVP585_22 [uncultured Caudovirales phage]
MIHIAKYEPGRTGGGWSFARNFVKGLGALATDYDKAQIYFITSASMVQRSDVEQAKADGKKIVLRVDNAIRNSRNRNTGMTRMYDMAQMADVVIYQSQWSKDYLEPFLKVDGEVILNGIDIGLFHPGKTPPPDHTYLYSRFNRDETKNYEVARYWFSRLEKDLKHLSIVGQFSEEIREGNFDFYRGEHFTYRGVLGEEAMTDLYRNCKHFIYTYFNDCCSNSLIEALCSGCEIVGDEYYRQTGGASEIIMTYKHGGAEALSLETMTMGYKEVLGL